MFRAVAGSSLRGLRRKIVTSKVPLSHLDIWKLSGQDVSEDLLNKHRKWVSELPLIWLIIRPGFCVRVRLGGIEAYSQLKMSMALACMILSRFPLRPFLTDG
jgi:hypothetical protein